jgi:mRNA interferase RelE/StbE
METPGQGDFERTVEIRLTAAAVDDLRILAKSDPQLLRTALMKMLILERNPMAGEPLSGRLMTFRKLKFGKRGHRIIWRSHEEQEGLIVIDVAIIWAVGARSDEAVYKEMMQRVSVLPKSPASTTLKEVVGRLGRAVSGIESLFEKSVTNAEVLPDWLLSRLVDDVGLHLQDAQSLTKSQALDVWTHWASKPKDLKGGS